MNYKDNPIRGLYCFLLKDYALTDDEIKKLSYKNMCIVMKIGQTIELKNLKHRWQIHVKDK